MAIPGKLPPAAVVYDPMQEFPEELDALLCDPYTKETRVDTQKTHCGHYVSKSTAETLYGKIIVEKVKGKEVKKFDSLHAKCLECQKIVTGYEPDSNEQLRVDAIVKLRAVIMKPPAAKVEGAKSSAPVVPAVAAQVKVVYVNVPEKAKEFPGLKSADLKLDSGSLATQFAHKGEIRARFSHDKEPANCLKNLYISIVIPSEVFTFSFQFYSMKGLKDFKEHGPLQSHEIQYETSEYDRESINRGAISISAHCKRFDRFKIVFQDLVRKNNFANKESDQAIAQFSEVIDKFTK